MVSAFISAQQQRKEKVEKSTQRKKKDSKEKSKGLVVLPYPCNTFGQNPDRLKEKKPIASLNCIHAPQNHEKHPSPS